MAHLLVQHHFQGMSGKAEDRFVNTFHFRAPDTVTETHQALLVDSVMAFYHDVPTGSTLPVTNWLSGWIDFEPDVATLYDMADPKPRAPQEVLTGTGGQTYGSGTSNLPPEVAVCLSYASAANSGVPVARRRGRIYLGPLSSGAVYTQNLNTNTEPLGDFKDALLNAAKDMQDAVTAGGCAWCVYSTVDDVLRTIEKAWVDNAWDTQRRRGVDPTAKSTLIF